VEHLDLSGPAASAAPVADVAPPAGRVVPLREQVDELQRRAILAAVERHGGRWAAAARELGLHRSNLHHLARRLGLKPKGAS
jgi:anaerobic nitric oxide reductase transcription regulator